MVGSYPASFQQRQFSWLQSLDPNSSAYNIPLIFTIEGEINIPLLEQSLCCLIRENDIFRAYFVVEQNELIAKTAQIQDTDLPIVDMSNEDLEALMDYLSDFVCKPFNLKTGPLYRTVLIKQEDSNYIWCFVLQHSICDLRTKDQLCFFLNKTYNSLLKSYNIPEEQLALPNYDEYAKDQKSWITTDNALKMKAFWRKLLEGVPVALSLPTDFPRPPYLQLQGTVQQFEFDEKTTNDIKELSKQLEVTPFLIMLTAFSVFLSRYSNQEQFMIGVPFTNRRNTRFENTLGCFMNILPIPIDMNKCGSIVDCMRELRRTMLLAHRNQELPIEVIIKEVNKSPQQLDRNPLYQVGFTFEPLSTLQLDGCSVQQRYVHHGGSQLDLFASFWEEGNTLQGVFEYNTTLFSSETILQWTQDYCYLVKQFLHNADQSANTIPLINPEELIAIESFSKGKREQNNKKNFIELFATQVRNNPEKTAIIFNDQEISYSVLNQIADKVAYALLQEGVKENQIVGVFMDRSVEMLAVIVGILKSGASYLPLDPEFPEERINFIIEDSNAFKVISNRRLEKRLSIDPQKMIFFEDIKRNESEKQQISKNQVSNDSAAYMIYTSGSTGNPKGVVITHGNLSNFISSIVEEPGITYDDRMLAITTISFDIHVLELIVPLTTGATIVMGTRECASNGAVLKKLIDDYHVTIIQATPTTWKVLCAAGWEGNDTLKILCGGEALSQDLAKKLLKRCKLLYNMYGPTETTVWSTFYNVTDATESIPIGRPIANTITCVVDMWGNTCPLGTWGELHVSGEGISKGYHNREDLTKSKFRAMQFFGSSEQRFYATGDICRLRSDGVLECAGRVDNQIKIRGYRIELEEIERIIETYPEVSNAAVAVHGEQDSEILVAFVVMEPGKTFDAFKIKSFLVSKLPEYMVPVRYVSIPSIPMTPNNKVDRKYLSTVTIPKTEIAIKDLSDNEIEHKLIEIWIDSLHLEVNSIDANFFDAGGNSLMVLTYSEIILKQLNINIPATTLFQYPTIRSLSQYLCTKDQSQSMAEKKNRINLQRKVLQAVAKRRK